MNGNASDAAARSFIAIHEQSMRRAEGPDGVLSSGQGRVGGP
jgi:hypothetical protein